MRDNSNLKDPISPLMTVKGLVSHKTKNNTFPIASPLNF